MKLRLIFVLAPLFFTVVPDSSTGQETSIGYRVWISENDPNLRLLKPQPCLLFLNEVRNEKCPASGTVDEPSQINPDERMGGWANIHRDAAETGWLHVNFWLPTEVCEASDSASTADCRRLRARRYVIPFENRQSQVFRSEGVQIKALTLPLKFRSGYSVDTVKVRSRAEVSISGNVFIGYRWGREKYYYERGAARNPFTKFHVTPGIFLGASAVSVSKETSRTADVPPLETIPIGAVSGGFGALVGWRNFSLGVFRGWDFGIGDVARDWDFDRRPYWSVGITLDAFLDSSKL